MCFLEITHSSATMTDRATSIAGSSQARNGSPAKPKPNSASPLGRSSSEATRRSTPSKSNGASSSPAGKPAAVGGDPLRQELIRLENELGVKAKELEKVGLELKGVKLQSIGKDKAIAELREELEKVKEQLATTEKHLGDKKLELKKVDEQRKAANASVAAAELAVRRLQASTKDSSAPTAALLLAPLEAQLKLKEKEVAGLHEDVKAQERLIRNQEVALLDAEKKVEAAEAKAKQVDNLQNRNTELAKEIETIQEEVKKLDKRHRVKVEELKKSTATITSLEEALTAAGASASTIRDLQRQVQEYQASQRTLQEELARAKVAANRVALAVANDWKDDTDKVIPMKQWLEERRFLQGEIQTLRERVASAERSARSEAQLKGKAELRLKVIEDGLKSKVHARRLSHSGTGSTRGTPAGTPGGASPSTGSDYGDYRAASSRMDDFGHTDGGQPLENGDNDGHGTGGENGRGGYEGNGGEDSVPGLVYDLLQKEVINLRRTVQEKDQSLKDKDDSIQMLSKKFDTLSKAMETEARKSRREVLALEKEVAALKADSAGSPASQETGSPSEVRARRLSMGLSASPSSTVRTTTRKSGLKPTT